jgi:hypothetical protein
MKQKKNTSTSFLKQVYGPSQFEDGVEEKHKEVVNYILRVEGYSDADEHLSLFFWTILIMALLWRLTNLPVMMTIRIVRSISKNLDGRSGDSPPTQEEQDITLTGRLACSKNC